VKPIVVIGGGISGLAAAWELQQQGLEYVLLENSERLGGKLYTERVDGFVIEGGADSYVAFKPAAFQLCREIGIAEDVIGTNDGQRNSFILSNGQLHTLPRGLRLIVPTDPEGLMESNLLSEEGKRKMLAEPEVPPRTETGDESMASFISRRFGQEALDIFATPLLAGIYSADPSTMSMEAYYPNYLQMEKKYGSVTVGSKQAPPPPPSAKSEGPKSMFASFRTGMSELVEGIQAKLTGQIRIGEGAASIDVDGTVHTTKGDSIAAEAVILTVPAWIAAGLVESWLPEVAQTLGTYRAVSSATVSLGFKISDLNPDVMNGFGFIVPPTEPTNLVACTWSSTKLSGRAPEGYALLRVFLGGYRHPDHLALSDEEAIALARAELKKTMGLTAEPVITRVYRWQQANPQYEVGHVERTARVKSMCPSWLFLGGSAFDGVGVPDCISQARATAKRVAASLSEVAAN
jgi:protoporphyrinogen/coproporphyrinogen III oxidase